MSEWKTVRLGDVATYINGYAFKPSDWGSEGLPIIRIQNLTGNDYETNYFNRKIPEKYYVKNGDVLISWSASLGVYEWKKNDALLNQHIFKVVFDKLEVDKKYFMFTVSNLLNAMSKQTHGSTMRHITKPDFDNMPFLLPPIEKQKQIACELDKCNELISKNKRILEKYDLLIKSRFIEMFGDPVQNPMGWEVKKLGDICTKISDGVHAKPEYTTTGKPFISVVNINSGKLLFDDCKYVSEEAYEKMIKSTHPEKGDILYTKVGATYGIPALVDTDRAFCLYVSVALLKPKSEIVNSQFLTTSMAQPYIKNQADKRIKGIGVPDLHLNQIREFEVLVPPLELQNQFNSFVQKIDKSKFAVQKSLEKAETLYNSLMQEYFN
jgi:type I restriction enzyme S subunit